jgi:hypothetical protein
MTGLIPKDMSLLKQHNTFDCGIKPVCIINFLSNEPPHCVGNRLTIPIIYSGEVH